MTPEVYIPLLAFWSLGGLIIVGAILTDYHHSRKQQAFLCIVGGPILWVVGSLYGIYKALE
jgi:hypothetical protein